MILLLEIHEAKKKNDGTSPLNQYIKKIILTDPNSFI